MPCDCCQTAREFPGYRRFDPACLWCGARYIRLVGSLPISREQATQRRQHVLRDWMQYGHAESDLRAWAKRADCFEPGPECSSESEPWKPTKPRSARPKSGT